MRQEVLKAAVNAVIATIKQGTPCTDPETGSCSYYQQGRRCVIGHTLTEDEARNLASFEGAVWEPEVRPALCRSLGLAELEGAEMLVLSALQHWHDERILTLEELERRSAVYDENLRGNLFKVIQGVKDEPQA